MKTKAKEKVLKQLRVICSSQGKVTANQLANSLNLSRQNINHYLIQLAQEGRIQKINGRPNYWIVPSTQPANDFTQSCLKSVIGYNGSLRSVINKCIAGIKYPPQGLNILITGNSGVGKSYLAKKLFEYSKESSIISTNAPFVVLNCADYADNPELLSATLFGYKRGAFTGADHDVQGLIANANEGYLFLDEIHRLSSENQEKLFLFMDTDKYRPVGEYNKWYTSKVRLIMATTEDPQKYFLDTFLRRIPIRVQLKDFSQRPLTERIELVSSLFLKEAHKLEKQIIISSEIMNALTFNKYSGNIGTLKNLIKISCAQAYAACTDKRLEITTAVFPGKLTMQKTLDTLVIDPNQKQSLLSNYNKYIYSDHLENLLQQVLKNVDIQIIKNKLEKFLLLIKNENDYNFEDYQSRNLLHLWNNYVVERYGVVNSLSTFQLCLTLKNTVLYLNQQLLNSVYKKICKKYCRTTYIVETFFKKIAFFNEDKVLLLKIVTALLISDFVNEKININGLIIAHGKSTASSIQEVVNQLCGNYIYEAIDMPINSSLTDVVDQVKKYLHDQSSLHDLILIIDTGSLNQIYTLLKNEIKGNLIVINNLTTSIALDVGIKINSQQNFIDITKELKPYYRIDIKSFDGFSDKNNIIISCMSGLGISKQLKIIFKKYLKNNFKIYTMKYTQLKEMIDKNDNDFFKKTVLIITTSNLPTSFLIPHFNIYNIFDSKNSNLFQEILVNQIGLKKYNTLIKELIKFFSIEGISARLHLLNPKIVINDIETVILRYENYLEYNFPEKTRLNLYMHLALMLERLLLSNKKSDSDKLPAVTDQKKINFLNISKKILHPLELKYNVSVSNYEISLLYELMSS